MHDFCKSSDLDSRHSQTFGLASKTRCGGVSATPRTRVPFGIAFPTCRGPGSPPALTENYWRIMKAYTLAAGIPGGPTRGASRCADARLEALAARPKTAGLYLQRGHTSLDPAAADLEPPNRRAGPRHARFLWDGPPLHRSQDGSALNLWKSRDNDES
jgi:hypothetical protein